jgi:hypothetical protein
LRKWIPLPRVKHPCHRWQWKSPNRNDSIRKGTALREIVREAIARHANLATAPRMVPADVANEALVAAPARTTVVVAVLPTATVVVPLDVVLVLAREVFAQRLVNCGTARQLVVAAWVARSAGPPNGCQAVRASRK